MRVTRSRLRKASKEISKEISQLAIDVRKKLRPEFVKFLAALIVIGIPSAIIGALYNWWTAPVPAARPQLKKLAPPPKGFVPLQLKMEVPANPFLNYRLDRRAPIWVRVVPPEAAMLIEGVVLDSPNGKDMSVQITDRKPGRIRLRFNRTPAIGIHKLEFHWSGGGKRAYAQVDISLHEELSLPTHLHAPLPSTTTGLGAGNLPHLPMKASVSIPNRFEGLERWCVYTLISTNDDSKFSLSLPQGLTVDFDFRNGNLLARQDDNNLALVSGDTALSHARLEGLAPHSFFAARESDAILVGMMTADRPLCLARFKLRDPDRAISNSDRLGLLTWGEQVHLAGLAIATYPRALINDAQWLP